MKNTKKITNINDYSKEVDKIIATGKPIVEQFMDLMGLMDVTFIDENQTSNGRLHQLTKSDSSKKQDKSVQDFRLSDCCGAKVLVTSAIPDEGTRYWKCSECGKPCNIMSRDGSQTKRKRDATTGSTVKAHLKCKTCNGKAVSSSGHCLACLSCHPSLPEIEELWDIVVKHTTLINDLQMKVNSLSKQK